MQSHAYNPLTVACVYPPSHPVKGKSRQRYSTGGFYLIDSSNAMASTSANATRELRTLRESVGGPSGDEKLADLGGGTIRCLSAQTGGRIRGDKRGKLSRFTQFKA